MCYIRFTENGLYLKLPMRSGARLMPDRNIPFYNIILRCENNIDSEIILPDGYSFRNYRSGDEKSWARLEYEIGDFETPDTAEEYLGFEEKQKEAAGNAISTYRLFNGQGSTTDS